MRLFIWHGAGVLSDYTDGQIAAIANDLDQAIALVLATDAGKSGAFPRQPTDVIDLGDGVKSEPRAWVAPGGG